MNALRREADERNPLAMRLLSGLPPKSSKPLGEGKTSRPRDRGYGAAGRLPAGQNLCEEKRSAGFRSGENEPDLISRTPVHRT